MMRRRWDYFIEANRIELAFYYVSNCITTIVVPCVTHLYDINSTRLFGRNSIGPVSNKGPCAALRIFI